MHAQIEETVRLTEGLRHHAFTDMCLWKGRYWCAYRNAASHGILPKGHLVVGSWDTEGTSACEDAFYAYNPWNNIVLTHPHGDMRDPKFFVTDDVLYLYCGIYLPNPAYRHLKGDTLSESPWNNFLITHMAHTIDGKHWSDFTPILRPNYWGWSMVRQAKTLFTMASYHTGTSPGDPSSIVLWYGAHPYALTMYMPIFGGSSFPSEPLLHVTDDNKAPLDCYVRMPKGMYILKPSPSKFNKWTVKKTEFPFHPGALLNTTHGLLIAGRYLEEKKQGRKATIETTTRLYRVNGTGFEHLLTLPSAGDTGYCGLAQGRVPNEIFLSWYSQHEMYTKDPDLRFPGAHVYAVNIILADA